MPKIATAARYEASTATIRSVPENYWLASLDSWDGAVDHEGNAKIMAASFKMLAALRDAWDMLPALPPSHPNMARYDNIRTVIANATGKEA